MAGVPLHRRDALLDRRLAARIGLAFLTANARYWPLVAPHVRAHLRAWRRRAETIPDPGSRRMALAKLREEGFNAEVAATLATLAPRRHRARAVEAIVALQFLYDYLDGVTELPLPDPVRDRERIYRAFTGVLACGTRAPDTYHDALGAVAGQALAQLPALDAIAHTAQRGLARCARAQTQLHAAAQRGDTAQLRAWAPGESVAGGETWRELLAGAASSVLAVHALIASAAAAGTTATEAVRIDAVYTSIGTLVTLLDSLVDRAQDAHAGTPGFASLFGEEPLPLPDIARRALAQTGAIAGGAHHAMTLLGVVAYYSSAAGAREPLAQPEFAGLQRALSPAVLAPLALMRLWRLAKRTRRAARGGSPYPHPTIKGTTCAT